MRKITVAIGDAAAAAQAAAYPLDVADSPASFTASHNIEDPLGEGGPKPTAMWLGSERALAQLGLERGQQVDVDDLALALQGRGTDGRQVRRPGWIKQKLRDEKRRVRRDPEGRPITKRRLGAASYDLTFSVPKSVSIVWSQADPELRARIEHAVMEAANAALGYMTQTKAVVAYRDGKRKLFGRARGFAAAMTLHVTSRRAHGEAVPSPQLHVHGILVGAERDDGRLVGVHSAPMFKRGAALEGDAVALTKLAEELIEMGFDLEFGTGRNGLYFEIRGVHPGLIEAMSARTHEIEEEAARREAALGRKLTNRERAALGMETRSDKGPSPSGAERDAAWKALVQEFEFGPEQVAALLRGPRRAVTPVDRRAAALAALERHITEHGPTLPTERARAIVYRTGHGSLEDSQRVLQELQDSGSLIALEGDRVTTQRVRSMEQHVLDVAIRAAQRPAVPLSERAFQRGVAFATEALKGGTLAGEQKKAIATLTQGRGWSVLTGRAGTGKTPVLQAVAEAHRADGWRVIACAVDWGTAQELGKDVRAEPLSIQQVLSDVRYQRLSLDRRTLILIDEASKVGTELWFELAKLIQGSGARMLAIGHDGQLGAIELPGMFHEMVVRADTIPTAVIHEIRRHRHKWMRDYQIAVDERRGTKAVGILRREGAITMYKTRADAMAGMVEAWDRARRELGTEDSLLIVQGSNKDVDDVDLLAQHCRLRADELEGMGVQAPDRDYLIYKNDLVVLRDAAYVLDDGDRIANGATGVVERVDAERKRMWVRIDGSDAEAVMIDLARAHAKSGPYGEKPAWRLGYAHHVLGKQGATKRSVGSLDGHWSQRAEGTYVAHTRQMEHLHCHADLESLGVRTVAEAWKVLAKRITTSQNELASIHYKETHARIAVDVPRVAPVPEVARPDGPTPAVDPLGPYRFALGERRAGWIEERARERAREAGSLHLEALRVERAAAREAFDRLDRDGALAVGRLERDQRRAERRRDQDLRHADDLEARAAKLKRRRQRRERRELREIAATQRALAVDAEAELERLAGAEQDLRDEGRHPGDWMRDDAETAAWFVAVERELAARLERATDRELERVVAEPPPDIVQRIGAAPERSAPERREWEMLARELEFQRLVAEGEAFEGMAAAPGRQADLDERIARLRRQRDLGPEPGDRDMAPDVAR